MDTTQVLKIQKELAQRTLAEPKVRHKRLYRLICDAGWLRAGLDAVLSNRGSHTPGVDDITKKTIDARPDGRDKLVQQLREELLDEAYQPSPVKRVYIPKASGGLRPLGIATLRDRAVQATIKMVLEPIYESVFHPCSWGFRPLRSTHHALSAVHRGAKIQQQGFKWVIEGDITACFDEIDHRRLRRYLKQRIQDQKVLDLITRLLRCGIWENEAVYYPRTGTPQGSVCSPLLANVYLHELDEWVERTYRHRPEWSHLAPGSYSYRRRKELGGTLQFTRYADDWVALWNGNRRRAEEIKAEFAAFLGSELHLRLSDDKTLITHIDDGFDFLGYHLTGGKRWSDGKWCLFSRVPHRAIERFREGVKRITHNPSTDEVAAFAALASLVRGWGNYYAYAAESRLMHSLDGYVYRELWKYCRHKNGKRGAKAVYQQYTIPRELRESGYCHLGVRVGDQFVRVPCLSAIPRKALRLPYPPHPYLTTERVNVLPWSGTTDQPWWHRQNWQGQEVRKGQQRLRVTVLARDKICRSCGQKVATEVHHEPPWRKRKEHNPNRAFGVCSTCHRQMK